MKNNPKNSKMLRTKKIASTVAALGAALGMNLQDVLANPSAGTKKLVQSSGQPRTLNPSEIDRVKKLRKGSSTLPSGLQKRPDTLAYKVTPKDQLTTRPSTRADKTSRHGLKTRPGVQGDKISPLHQNRPDLKTR